MEDRCLHGAVRKGNLGDHGDDDDDDDDDADDNDDHQVGRRRRRPTQRVKLPFSDSEDQIGSPPAAGSRFSVVSLVVNTADTTTATLHHRRRRRRRERTTTTPLPSQLPPPHTAFTRSLWSPRRMNVYA